MQSKYADLESIRFKLGRGLDDIYLVYPSQGNAVQLERAGDQHQSALQLLQEHDTLPVEAACEQDQDGAGGVGRVNVGGVGRFTALLGQAHILCGVEVRRF
jgi:hypothetical protein